MNNPVNDVKTIVLDREDLCNLLDGIGVPPGGVEGLSRLTGVNDKWEWDKDVLASLTEIELWMMYRKCKQDKANSAILLVRPKILTFRRRDDHVPA